jgi:protein-S-isoprenylcysteine O-methyltransferase Ste14
MLFVILLFSFLPLLVSGRRDWWEGWAYALLILLHFIASRALLIRYNPDLALERSRSLAHTGVKPWDRILAPVMALGGTLISASAGLGVRFGAEAPFSPPVQAMAFLLILFGLVIGTWAMMKNCFFSGVVRIQTERGHTVVTAGPYTWVRHPGYSATLLSFIALPFFLNAPVALLSAGFLLVISILRTSMEDAALMEELPGYQEYSRTVRYRLVPGVW